MCNLTAKSCIKSLRRIGIDAYPYEIPISSQNPVYLDKLMEHFVALVNLNNILYIYDQPQTEFLKPSKDNKNTFDYVSEYNPRFIELNADNLVKNYGLSKEIAEKTITLILNTKISKYSVKEYIEDTNNVNQSTEIKPKIDSSKKIENLKRGDIINFQQQEFLVERVKNEGIDVRDVNTGDVDFISTEDYINETQEQPIVEEKENVAIKEFYNSLTKEEKIKLGTLDKIIDDYNQIPFEISEKEYIDQLNCKK